MIKGEYEIDKNDFIETIIKDNERYISLQDGAGSGKSVLCKKYVENQEVVLYARVERFMEESLIDNIWDCCIQDVLECLDRKKLIFFIDALEFIADCAKTKFSIKIYEVGDITEDELTLIMKKYPIIHKMCKMNSYVDLLKSPFI